MDHNSKSPTSGIILSRDNTVYSCRKWTRVGQIFWNLLFFGSVSLATIIGFFVNMYDLITNKDSSWIGAISILFAYVFIFGGINYLVLKFFAPRVNECPKIRVLESGLLIRTFNFRFVWAFVPWQEIEGLTLSSRLDRWMKPVWAIQVKRLTFWHCLLGNLWLNENDSKPAIILTSDLNRRDELLEIVETHLQHLNTVAKYVD